MRPQSWRIRYKSTGALVIGAKTQDPRIPALAKQFGVSVTLARTAFSQGRNYLQAYEWLRGRLRDVR